MLAAVLKQHALVLNPERVYATGWSNGGFMASLVAKSDHHRQKQEHGVKIKGVAPIAGHVYDLSDSVPGPVAMHWCADDPMVRWGGCCTTGHGGGGGGGGHGGGEGEVGRRGGRG